MILQVFLQVSKAKQEPSKQVEGRARVGVADQKFFALGAGTSTRVVLCPWHPSWHCSIDYLVDSNVLIKFQLRCFHFFLFSIIVLMGQTILFFCFRSSSCTQQKSSCVQLQRWDEWNGLLMWIQFWLALWVKHTACCFLFTVSHNF